eukprot:COSAG01_NODE_12772_length_1688_cov_1.752675_1_plen_58_part_00
MAAAGAAAGRGSAHPTNGLGGMCGEPAVFIVEPAHIYNFILTEIYLLPRLFPSRNKC